MARSSELGGDAPPAGEEPVPAPGRPRRAVPAVSVLLTTAATPADLLERAIASITGQTLRDLELIVVLDGDPDPDQAGVITAASEADERIVVLAPGRIGRGAALNLAIASSSARLLAIQDADDESHRRRLELQVEALGAHPEVALLGTRARLVTGREGTAGWDLPDDTVAVRRVTWRVLVTNPLVHTSVLVRREALDAVGGYDESRSWQFDHDLYLRLHDRGLRLGLLDLPLVLKRRHGAQAFETSDASARLASSHRLQVDAARRQPLLRRTALRAVISSRHQARRLRTHVKGRT